jgi:hypothetical protein
MLTCYNCKTNLLHVSFFLSFFCCLCLFYEEHFYGKQSQFCFNVPGVTGFGQLNWTSSSMGEMLHSCLPACLLAFFTGHGAHIYLEETVRYLERGGLSCLLMVRIGPHSAFRNCNANLLCPVVRLENLGKFPQASLHVTPTYSIAAE